MALVLDVQVQLVEMQCCVCSVIFAIPTELKKRRIDDHKLFWCPNGHEQMFTGPSEAERLRKELEREKEMRASERRSTDFWRDRANATERRLSAQKGQNTKLRKRIGNGVCPCCNRHFTNVERHMASQHPDWSAGEQPEEA